MCGEARNKAWHAELHRGPSPRVRGSPGRNHQLHHRAGSIPACAGKALPGGAPTPNQSGPSPRVRGSPLSPRPSRGRSRGSIPACAGKPRFGGVTLEQTEVHPRVCGEAGIGFMNRVWDTGPSPRVRGSHRSRGRCHGGHGSIPACAGKPFQAVHRLPSASGSIPACAGKPPCPLRCPERNRVHPRVCGEAACNPLNHPCRIRSIPACAGSIEDVRQAIQQRGPSRVCGEATGHSARTWPASGPSRVCGEPRRH